MRRPWICRPVQESNLPKHPPVPLKGGNYGRHYIVGRPASDCQRFGHTRHAAFRFAVDYQFLIVVNSRSERPLTSRFDSSAFDKPSKAKKSKPAPDYVAWLARGKKLAANLDG